MSSRDLGAGREPDLRSFVVDLTTKDGDLGISSITNVLHRGLLDKVPVEGDAPCHIQSVGREQCGSGVDSGYEGGIWNSTKTFQSVRSRSASGELHQVVVGGLVLLAVGLVEGSRVTRLLIELLAVLK